MLLLAPALLIAKAATLLPLSEWEFTPEALASYLTAVDTAKLQTGGDTTVRMLVTVHTALVLVQAATRKFSNGTMVVSGFSKEEVGEKVAPGDFEPGAIQKNADEIAQASGASGANLGRRLSQDAAQRLQHCLKELAGLPVGFQVGSCLATCRQAAEHTDVNDRCLLTALTLVQCILNEANLDQARMWANDPHITGDISNWLTGELDADVLEQRAKSCFVPASTCSAETKMALNRIVKMLENNDHFFNSIDERLVALKEAINGFPPTLTDEITAWTNLVRAMYGAVGWHIFRQARLAAREARITLARS
jgi:hypothetical protein